MNNRKFVLALAAIFVAASAEAADFNLTVIDGDTLRQGKDRLRLLHIDAPETHEPRCPAERRKGKQATARLRQLIRSAWDVQVRDSGERDKYGRRLVDLYLDGKDVGDILIAEGLAVPWEPGSAAWRERRAHWCGF